MLFLDVVVVVIKYNNFCGVVLVVMFVVVVKVVLEGDFVSVFGLVLVFNYLVDVVIVEYLVIFGLFVEVIVVLEFSLEVLEIFIF